MNDIDFPNIDAADAILSETRALLGMPMKFTTGSRTGLFGGIKKKIADFKSTKTAPAHPCRKCGAAKAAPGSLCPVCGANSSMTTNIMHRGEFEKLAAKDKSTFCRSGGTITDRAAGATLTAAQVSTDKTLPRAAFSALSPSKKSAFAKAGGKLTD